MSLTDEAAWTAISLAKTHGARDATRICDLELARAEDEHDLDRARKWELARRLLLNDHKTIVPFGGE